MSPVRIQRKRTKGWRMPEGAVYVGRPSRWGNPYRCGDRAFVNEPFDFPVPTVREAGEYDNGLRVDRATCHTAVDWFRAWLGAQTGKANWLAWIGPLAGRDLACWCPLDQPCHADVLLELANR